MVRCVYSRCAINMTNKSHAYTPHGIKKKLEQNMINKCLIIVSEQNPISIQHRHISFYKTYVFLQQCHIDSTFFYIMPNMLVCHNQIEHKFRTYLRSHRHNAVLNSFAMQHTMRAKIFKLFVLRKKKVGPNKHFSGHFTQWFAFDKKNFLRNSRANRKPSAIFIHSFFDKETGRFHGLQSKHCRWNK